MVNRYGTDEVVFQTLTGTLQSDDGSPLLSTSSDGGTAYAIGDALSAGIYSGIQNGNLSAPPQAIGSADQISDSNPLPYFTFVDSSSGRITAYAVEDSLQANGYSIRFRAIGAQSGDKVYLERRISAPSSRAQSYVYSARGAFTAASNTAGYSAFVETQYLKADGTTTTGSANTAIYAGTVIQASNSTALELVSYPAAGGAVPSDGASILFRTGISFSTAVAGTVSIDLVEMRLVRGTTVVPFVDQVYPGESGGIVAQTGRTMILHANSLGTAGSNPKIELSTNTGTIYINAAGTISGGGTPTSGDIVLTPKTGGFVYLNDGSQSSAGTANIKIYFQSGQFLRTDAGAIVFGTNLRLNESGTNSRVFSATPLDTTTSKGIDIVGSTSSTAPGILITKSVLGQPSTTLNGTATTDAFADVLRNGGLAVDSTNARLYAYSGGAWRYAALTTPSDSRLKEEVHEISGALSKLRELAPVSFKWKKPEAHPRTDAVIHNEENFGFIADHVATTSLGHWVETMGAGEYEKEYVEDETLLAVNIPQNEIEALIVQSLIDLDNRITAIEEKL
jgi:hypothetical protein